MPPTSLVKFAGQGKDSNGNTLHWHRAGEDGSPYRSKAGTPTLTKEEFEEHSVRVADPRNGTFDTSNAEQNQQYLIVLDGVANNWYQLLYIERWREEGEKHHIVYVEWLEYFMEDGSTRARAGQGESSYGSSPIPPQ
jgi:hypothetical protein